MGFSDQISIGLQQLLDSKSTKMSELVKKNELFRSNGSQDVVTVAARGSVEKTKHGLRDGELSGKNGKYKHSGSKVSDPEGCT